LKIIALDREDPETWLVGPAVDALRRGELIVMPTDGLYALACLPWEPQAVSRLYKAKRMDLSKRCSVICGDLKDVGSVTRAVDDDAFRFMRNHLPGPYTVLLHASRDLPRNATGKRKGIGVRIPDHPVPLALVEAMGHPILVSSLPGWVSGEELDPVERSIELFVHPTVILDQGPQITEPSTVVDFTTPEPELVRQGGGEVYGLLG
jgi:tRNA threonylcarbamoyl adenosine modification protein (Sua5/YciO/YrdC/YwlC family)